MSPCEIIILSSVARMIMAFCEAEQPREFEVDVITRDGRQYDVVVPKSASGVYWHGDGTVVLAGNQDARPK